MSNHVYKIVEFTGSSTIGTDDAIRQAIAKAGESDRGIHCFEKIETRGMVEDNVVSYRQVSIKVGFTLEG